MKELHEFRPYGPNHSHEEQSQPTKHPTLNSPDTTAETLAALQPYHVALVGEIQRGLPQVGLRVLPRSPVEEAVLARRQQAHDGGHLGLVKSAALAQSLLLLTLSEDF